MDTSKRNAWIFMGSTVAGAVGGWWTAPRIVATLGYAFGPWGSVVGAAIGGLLGVSVASMIVGDVDFSEMKRPRGGSLPRSG